MAKGPGGQEPRLLVLSLCTLSFRLLCPLLKTKVLPCTPRHCVSYWGLDQKQIPGRSQCWGLASTPLSQEMGVLNGPLRQGRTPQSPDCVLTNWVAGLRLIEERPGAGALGVGEWGRMS